MSPTLQPQAYCIAFICYHNAVIALREISEKSVQSRTKKQAISQTLRTAGIPMPNDNALIMLTPNAGILFAADELKGLSLLMPAAALTGFALEVGLKAIALLKMSVELRGHKVEDLFKNLSIDLQTKLQEGVKNKINCDTSKFQNLLRRNSDLFVGWRYAHEGKNHGLTADFHFCDAFMLEIRSIMQE